MDKSYESITAITICSTLSTCVWAMREGKHVEKPRVMWTRLEHIRDKAIYWARYVEWSSTQSYKSHKPLCPKKGTPEAQLFSNFEVGTLIWRSLSLACLMRPSLNRLGENKALGTVILQYITMTLIFYNEHSLMYWCRGFPYMFSFDFLISHETIKELNILITIYFIWWLLHPSGKFLGYHFIVYSVVICLYLTNVLIFNPYSINTSNKMPSHFNKRFTLGVRLNTICKELDKCIYYIINHG